MTFSAEAWQRTTRTRQAIETLPFLTELSDATLPRETFVEYLAQDTLYLNQYGRALALAAGQADSVPDAVFWLSSSREAFLVEQQLHGSHVTDLSAHPASPTTTAYTCYLLAQASAGCYPVLAAALLPCFWLYSDTGERLLARTPDLASHPYGDWIGTYADDQFAATSAEACRLLDRLAAEAGPQTRERMHQAFATASRYEWMFWDAAYRRERWPV